LHGSVDPRRGVDGLDRAFDREAVDALRDVQRFDQIRRRDRGIALAHDRRTCDLAGPPTRNTISA
jgi:hypothetical protein